MNTIIELAVSLTVLIVAFFPVLGRAIGETVGCVTDDDVVRTFVAWLITAAIFTAIVCNGMAASEVWKAMR